MVVEPPAREVGLVIESSPGPDVPFRGPDGGGGGDMGNLNSDSALVPVVGDEIDVPIAGVLGAVAAPEGPLEELLRFGGYVELKSGDGCAAKDRCVCGAMPG